MRLLPPGFLLLAAGWLGWRGPRGDGSSAEKQVPLNWDAEMPGEGHSSPIILGRHVFVTAALPETEERLLLCLDRDSGRELWRRTVMTSPLERKHRENSYASSTPATGATTVVKPGPTFEVVAHNTLGEPTSSSPAISDGHLFLRGAKHLYCFGEKH